MDGGEKTGRKRIKELRESRSPEVGCAGEAEGATLLTRPTSRRSFLKMGAFTVAAGLTSTSLLNAFLADPANADKMPIVINAKGVLLAEPSRCSGCRRCELACTEFNDGKSHPVISRIKVYRNYHFGPQGVQNGYYNSRGGKMGNMRIIQETCKQCPHPVPCADVCPRGAIEASPKTNARVVNADKCVGCKICMAACPWNMISYDPDTKKATKCFLCDGHPECAAACPNGAIKYISWVDLTKQTMPRSAVYRKAPDDSCLKCH